MKKTWMLGLAAAVAVGLGAAWLKASKPTAASRAAAPVVLAKAETRDVPLLLELTGRSEASESVSLRARVDGQVSAVPMKEGAHVRQGELLVQLDPADFAARLAQAEANLARDKAQAVKAKADVERYNVLKAKGFVSEESVAGVRTTGQAQEATMKASQAAVDLARLQLGYTAIRAPFDGVVGAKLVFPGTAVKTNDTLLAVVNKIQPLFVSFAVPEKYLPKIQAGMKNGVMNVQVAVPGVAGPALIGEARFLDNTVDPTTGTIRMKAKLENKDERLAAGQFLNVSLEYDQLKGVVVVPAEAVQQGPEGPYVYVARSDQTVEMRKVDVVANQRGLALLGNGLQAEETVVVDGQLRLSPGAPYQALPTKTEAANVPTAAVAPSTSGTVSATSTAPSAGAAPVTNGRLSATASR